MIQSQAGRERKQRKLDEDHVMKEGDFHEYYENHDEDLAYDHFILILQVIIIIFSSMVVVHVEKKYKSELLIWSATEGSPISLVGIKNCRYDKVVG